MTKRFRHICLWAAGVALLTGCVRRPDGVLSDSEMAKVVADLTLAEAYLKTSPDGRGSVETREEMINYIIDKHGLSREEFDTTMAWYGRNIDEYYELLDNVDKEIARRKTKMVGGASQVETNDLWPYSRMTIVSPLGSTDGMSFSFPAGDLTPGQRLQLRMRLATQSRGNLLFGVEYDNGVKAYAFSTLRGKKVDIQFQTDTAYAVTRIFGNMTLEETDGRPLWVDSIYLTTLPYDSLEYYRKHSQRVWREPVSRRVNPNKLEDMQAQKDTTVSGADAPANPQLTNSQNTVKHNDR